MPNSWCLKYDTKGNLHEGDSRTGFRCTPYVCSPIDESKKLDEKGAIYLLMGYIQMSKRHVGFMMFRRKREFLARMEFVMNIFS